MSSPGLKMRRRRLVTVDVRNRPIFSSRNLPRSFNFSAFAYTIIGERSMIFQQHYNPYSAWEITSYSLSDIVVTPAEIRLQSSSGSSLTSCSRYWRCRWKILSSYGVWTKQTREIGDKKLAHFTKKTSRERTKLGAFKGGQNSINKTRQKKKGEQYL